LAASQEHTGSNDPQSVTVSIVIPCYNYGPFLTEAIESALAQTLPAGEILIVDDGSTDNSREIALRYTAIPAVRVIKQENQGAIATYNNGVRASAGQFFVILSADDRLDPYFLERTAPVLLRRPMAGYVYTAYRMFGVRQRVLPALPYNARRLRLRPHIAATSLIRRAAFDQVGGFNASMSGGREDWDFYVALDQQGWVGEAAPEVLFHYRKHGGGSRNAISFRQLLAARAQVYRNHPSLTHAPLPLWLALTEIDHTILRARAAPRALLRKLGPNGRALGSRRICRVVGDSVRVGYVPENESSAEPRACPAWRVVGPTPEERARPPAGSVPLLSGLFRVGRLCRRALYQRAAIYHAKGLSALAASALAASITRAYLTYEPCENKGQEAGSGASFRGILERCLLWRVDALLADNPYTARALQNRLGAQAMVLDYHDGAETGQAASPRARLARLYRDLLDVTGNPPSEPPSVGSHG